MTVSPFDSTTSGYTGNWVIKDPLGNVDYNSTAVSSFLLYTPSMTGSYSISFSYSLDVCNQNVTTSVNYVVSPYYVVRPATTFNTINVVQSNKYSVLPEVNLHANTTTLTNISYDSIVG